METYHRKRSKRPATNANNEITSLKWQETDKMAQSQLPHLASQWMVNFEAGEVPDEEIELGSVYEMYHKNLPPRTPVQLMSTRVVMVSEKTAFNVGIRYPSSRSLRVYFSSGVREMYPALDEKFVMGTKLARKVLLRQVPSKEFAEKKHLECFWVVNPNSQVIKTHVKNEEMGLARELKNNMITWGVRRQVMFVQSSKDLSNTQSSSSFVQGEEEQVQNQQEIKNVVCKEDEEIGNEENVEAEEEIQHASTRTLRKRKKGKIVNHSWQVNRKAMKKCRKLAVKNPTDRWSKERYLAAEVSLLEAMKEKKAMIGNPITRPELRVEARKRIGDTGLLDHLLKHVANKVAPGGTLRFRRSHNADGAMEYWLEDADLVKIRKDAGVKDPFWIPPPGWKLGDSPIQDPIVAKEINHLKQEISNIKRESEEEIAKIRREIEELASKNKQDQSEAIVVSEHIDSNPKQLMDIFNYLMHHLESGKSHDGVANSILPKAWKQTAEFGKEKTEAATKGSLSAEDEEKGSEKVAEKNVTGNGRTLVANAAEGKAAKIERLKSAFRIICRPQARTILWPNMVNSPPTTQPSSQVEDLLVVPTPPSVNSITPPKPLYQLLPSDPVKPIPERRPLTLSTLPPPPSTINSLTHSHII